MKSTSPFPFYRANISFSPDYYSFCLSLFISLNDFWSCERGISSPSYQSLISSLLVLSGRFDLKPRTSSLRLSALHSSSNGFSISLMTWASLPLTSCTEAAPGRFPGPFCQRCIGRREDPGVLPSHTKSSRVHDDCIWCISVSRNPWVIRTSLDNPLPYGLPD